MKLILDFDDTLSDNSKLKERIYKCLEDVGVPRNISENFYEEMRINDEPFSLKSFLRDVFNKENIAKVSIEDIYNKIIEICPEIVNQQLLSLVRRLGRGNCYIITNGDEEYQKDKIKRSNLEDLFCDIVIVPKSKKEIISRICEDNPSDSVIFVDNKKRFFDDLDMSKCPNLQTVLFDKDNLEKLLEVIEKSE